MDSTKISTTRHILVVNGKGGCGKTTVATNLAAAYAATNHDVALCDYDAQASSHYWAEVRQRSDDQLPRISALASFKRPNLRETTAFSRRATECCDIVVMDAPCTTTTTSQFEDLLRLSDVIIVPVISSAMDVRASKRFITDLLTHRVFRARPRPLGVVGNRVTSQSANFDQLEQFLACSGIAMVGHFRDTPVYSEAADAGVGITELKENRAARKEYRAWHQLMAWIDEQTGCERTHAASARPLAASRKPDLKVREIQQNA